MQKTATQKHIQKHTSRDKKYTLFLFQYEVDMQQQQQQKTRVVTTSLSKLAFSTVSVMVKRPPGMFETECRKSAFNSESRSWTKFSNHLTNNIIDADVKRKTEMPQATYLSQNN